MKCRYRHSIFSLNKFLFFLANYLNHNNIYYIKDDFENITITFSIDKSKIVNFSTYNGSNMMAVVKVFLGTKKRIPCVAHTINLIIDRVLQNNRTFSNLTDQIKCIVTYFKHSVSPSDQLLSEQLAEGKKGQILMLIQAVSTR